MTVSVAKYLALPLLAALACPPAHASFPRSTDAVMQPGEQAAEGQAVTSATAVSAGQRARVARLRAQAGGGQFRPATVCDTDIVNKAEWSGDTTILVGQMCPSYMRNR